MIAVMILVIYHDYIFGSKLFLSSYDAEYETLPFMMHIADYLRSDGFPMWSFSIGLGSALDLEYIGDPFKLIPILLGREAIPYALLAMHIIKVYLTAFFCYRFFLLLSVGDAAAIYGSISICFCSIMVIRGHWLHYGTEVCLFSFLLYSLETYFQKAKWHMLIPAIVLLFIYRSLTYVYFYCIFLFLYATIRYICLSNRQQIKYRTYITKCAGILLLSLTISAVFVFPYLLQILNSGRFANTMGSESIWKKIFTLYDPSMYVREFFSFFSPYPLIDSNAAYNWDELISPLFYCGIPMLFLLPQGFIQADKKTRKLFLFILAIGVMQITLPGMMFIANAFVNSYYFKMSTLWYVFGLMSISVYGLNVLLQQCDPCRKSLIYTCMLLLSSYLIVGIFLSNKVVLDPLYKILVPILLLTCCFILLLLANAKLKQTAMVVFCLFICGELCLQNDTYYARNAYAVLEPKTVAQVNSDIYANAEEFADLNKADPNWYRIASSDYAFYFTHPIAMNYKGTSHYETYLGKPYTYFLLEMRPEAFIMANQSLGLGNRYMLNSLFGVKYFWDKRPLVPMGYEQTEESRFWQNQYALPIGFTYDSMIEQSVLRKLNFERKDLALLNAAVIDEGVPHDYLAVMDTGSLAHAVSYSSPVNFVIKDFEQYNMDTFHDRSTRFTSAMSKDALLIFPEPCSSGSYEIEFKIRCEEPTGLEVVYYDGYDWYSIWSRLHKGDNKVVHQTNYISPNFVGIKLPDNTSISELRFNRIDRSAIDIAYIQAVENRKQESFLVSTFSQNRITGTIDASSDKLLFFSIPYNRGWSIKIDGEQRKPEIVNIGFLGTPITEGEHYIELTYRTPGLLPGGILSALGVLIYLIMIVNRKRISFLNPDGSKGSNYENEP